MFKVYVYVVNKKYYNNNWDTNNWDTLNYLPETYKLTADFEMAEIIKTLLHYKKYFYHKNDFRCFNCHVVFFSIL
jgi:hypothetical protein